MKQFFKDLFEYSHHFNQRLWEVFNEHPDQVPEKAVKLYSHILNAHQVWNSRIDPSHLPFGVWDIHSIQDCKEIDKVNYERSLEILDRFNLDEIIHYTKGQTFRNSVREILFHVINHSTYHRAQIATEFRQGGIEPVMTDYVLYKRMAAKL